VVTRRASLPRMVVFRSDTASVPNSYPPFLRSKFQHLIPCQVQVLEQIQILQYVWRWIRCFIALLDNDRTTTSMQPVGQPANNGSPAPQRRGRGKPWRKGECGALRLSKPQLEVIGSLTKQIVERDGKPPSPADHVLISQIARLACASKREDAVRNARAIGQLLAQLGLAGGAKPAAEPKPSLRDYLQKRAAADAEKAAPP